MDQQCFTLLDTEYVKIDRQCFTQLVTEYVTIDQQLFTQLVIESGNDRPAMFHTICY